MEFIQHGLGQFIFVTAILTLGFSVFVRLPKTFIIEAMILGAVIYSSALPENQVFFYLLGFVQFVYILFAIYKFKKAADRDYLLVLEKTHQIPRKLTLGGNFGDE